MTVYRRFVFLLFLMFLFQSSSAMSFDQELRKVIGAGSGYSVMTVTRNAKIVGVDARNVTYEPFCSLGDDAINRIFQEIRNTLSSVLEPVLVVFNEYFFARDLLNFDDFFRKLSIIKQASTETPKAIYYVNFLHEMHPGMRADDYQKLKFYSDGVSDIFSQNPPDKGQGFSVTACDRRLRTVSPGKPLFANETLVVFNGTVISTYKKSTYYHEADHKLDTIDGKNANALTYLYGKGEDEIVSDLSGVHKSVSEILHSMVYTDICWDVVQRVRLAREAIVSRDFSHRADVISESAAHMKAIFGASSIPISSFKLHIIQSDSVNIHPHISDFPDGQILVHSDSRTFSVIKILYPEHLCKRLAYLNSQMPDTITSRNSDVVNTIIAAKDDEIKRSFASIIHTFPREEKLYEFMNDDDTINEIWMSLTKIQ